MDSTHRAAVVASLAFAGIVGATTLSAGRAPTTPQADVPVVSAPGVAREVDSLRLVRVATARYCGTGGATGYMQLACLRIDGIIFRLANLPSYRLIPDTVVRVRVDTLYRASGPVLAGYYGSPRHGWPNEGVDTVTVCGTIHLADHSTRIAWPPVRIRVIGDSAVMGLRSGNPLEQMCRASLGDRVTVIDSVPVAWRLEWTVIDGRRLLRPTFNYP